MVVYSDISPRTSAYADKRLLTRATPNNILDQFGQVRQLPSKSSKTITFRRYNKLAVATAPLSEGVTPSGKSLTKTDITAILNQYGDFVQITDVIMDTHEDPILKESTDLLGEQAAETYDVLRAGILKAGTNVLYSNGTARSSVNTEISRTLLRRAERTLLRQEAKVIKEFIKAGANISTHPIAGAFIAVCHADLKMDLEAINDFIPTEQYASQNGLINGEIGACGMIRFVLDNNLSAWADAGGAAGSTYITTTGTSADVYPVLIFGKDAYGIVPLAGKNAVSTYVNNPKPITGDELAQRGSVGWKGYTTAAILNDLWMLRLEVAVTL